MAFRGTFDYSLDAKNRLTVPAKFRAVLSDGLVLAKGVEQCVQLWSAKDYESFTADATQGFHRLSPEGRKRVDEIYAKHCKQPEEVVHRDMERDRFFTAEQAVEYGLIDQVLTNRNKD